MGNDYTIASVSRALKILKLFDEKNAEMTLTEISVKMDITKSSAMRALYTCEQEGFVRYDSATKKYKLGIQIFKLCNTAYDFLDLKQISPQYLKPLVEETKLVAHLGILEDSKGVIINKIWPQESVNSIAMLSGVGKDIPLHCTGIGKILLAHLNSTHKEKVLKNYILEKHTETTITNKEELYKELEKVKQNGYAENNGEREAYIRCIAYPIRDFNGVVAALSLTGLNQIVDMMDMNILHQKIQDVAKKISQRLGG